MRARPLGLGELPRRPVAERREVEVVRDLEVVGCARRVRDARADPGQAKGPQRFAQVAATDEVPLACHELQPVGIDLPCERLIAADRVVVEAHGLAVGDRRLQLRKGRRAGVRSCLRQDRERRRSGVRQQLGPSLRQAQQGEAQRLGVREPVLEDREAGGECRQLLRCELDGRQVVGVRRQAVHLAAALRRRLGGDRDAEPLKLRPVFVEAALEGVLASSSGSPRHALGSARRSPVARHAIAAWRRARAAVRVCRRPSRSLPRGSSPCSSLGRCATVHDPPSMVAPPTLPTAAR